MIITLDYPLQLNKSWMLDEYLKAQGIPIDGGISCYDENTVEIPYLTSAAPEDIERGNALTKSFKLPPDPDWDAFRDSVVVAPAWKLLAQSQTGIAIVLAILLFQLKENSSLLGSIAKYWNIMIALSPALTPEQVEFLKDLAMDTNMPFHFADDGSVTA